MSSTTPKIVRATISAMPVKLFDAMPIVHAYFDDDVTKKVRLFNYYPDELSFTESEFVGLTHQQAIALKTRKDSAYLRA